MNDMGYLLLVEDEVKIQENNKKILSRRGYALRQAYTLAEAREIIETEPPRAIVLDIQLPDGSGLDFLGELRRTSNVPVLMLTAKGTREDILRGLSAGGDDYLPKPYDLAIFLSRVEALLRRASIVPEELALGRLKIDLMANKAYLDGEDMCLATKELSLLTLLVQNPEKAFSAEYLYEKAWGQRMAGDNQALRKTISRLRSKLENSGYKITFERSEGYTFERE